MSGYFHQPRLVGWLAFVAFGLGSASLYYGPFVAWVSWMARRQAAGPLVLAAGWGSVEFARAQLLLADPWGLSAYSQVSFPPLMQIADATGPYGVAVLVGGVNACVAALVEPRLRGRRPRRAAATLVAGVLVALAYGEWRLAQREPAGETTLVAVVQSAGRADHDDAGRGPSRLERYRELTRGLAGSPQLIVWPESALDFYVEDDSSQRRTLLATSREHAGVELLVGGLGRTTHRGQRRPHNSAFLLRDGRLVGRHHKAILYPVAERALPAIGGGSGLVPGDAPAPVPSRHGPIAVVVCVESMHPDYVRRLAREARLLVNISNDAWFAHPVPAAHQLAITSVRAIENRRWLVRASASGFSAVVDPTGRVVAQSVFGRPDTLSTTIRWLDGDTPYQRWGDVAAWAAVITVVAGTLHGALRGTA